ncbi:MAG: PQQ-dependent sugar dehydrogenase [Candidatus Levybacteria bacterium]|nr:PQQ-dependent sugar dehydrogenase [Candidatus Levybacteria bacterium]MBI2420717.1 PQQ-dependent sugar dehydrogenase [Candidatus Levybacteria bacterium]
MKRFIISIAFLFIFIWAGFFIWNNIKSSPVLEKTNALQTPSEDEFQKAPKISVFAKNLEVPWAMAFLPDGELLVTERKGSIRFIDKEGNIAPSPVAEIQVAQNNESGLHGIVIHPDFDNNQFVYIYYAYSSTGGNNLNRVVRFKFDGRSFSDEKIILDKIPAANIHDGGRIKFGPDGYLYVTTGDAAEPSLSQNKNSLAGKILRVTDNGNSAPGNPFGTTVFSYGHRNPQGLAWDDNGNLWETEHGSSAHDEFNKIQAGGNYGWPDFIGGQTADGIISPILQSGTETWAPAGMAYLNGSLFFAGLRGESLFQAVLNGDNAELARHFQGEYGRIRDVVVGPDGFLYITTSNRDGRGFPRENDDKILRINPQKL